MARGKALSDDLRAAIIDLARHFDVDNIVEYTGCKRRTVERTLADYRRLGVVLPSRDVCFLISGSNLPGIESISGPLSSGAIQPSTSQLLDSLQQRGPLCTCLHIYEVHDTI
jgi:hypothetical protein